MDILTYRNWGIIFATLSLLVLAAVYISQYGFGLSPCKLCHYQRIPYFFALGVSLGLIVMHHKVNGAKIALYILGFVFFISIILAVFHMGVEYKWWTYASDCTGGDLFKMGNTAEDFLAALKKAPVTRCDEPVKFLFGMSMAFYNVITSAVLTGMALFAAIKPIRK